MAYDSLTLSILTAELRKVLIGGKISKILQPEKDEVILLVYCAAAAKGNSTQKLIVSANATINRIHLTQQNKDNPSTAFTFCMLLRKHINNAVITDINQMPYERVVDFTLETRDELGYRAEKHFIFELTGKTANIILTDENYKIIDTLKHLPNGLDAQRILLNGVKYEFFPPRQKLTLEQTDRLRVLLDDVTPPYDEFLTDCLLGVSRATVNEILNGVKQAPDSPKQTDKILEGVKRVLNSLANPSPNICFINGAPNEVYPFDYLSVRGEKRFYATLNEAHDNFYNLKDKSLRFATKAKNVHTTVKTAIARLTKKIALQTQDMLAAQNNDHYKLCGDLILANLHLITRQADVLHAINYYEQDCPTIEITLDPSKSPQENAQEYYKKYRKQKSTLEHTKRLIEQSQRELEHVSDVAQALNNCDSENELNEIIDELRQAGFIKDKNKTKQKITPSTPRKYIINGFTVLVGKNNAQNDRIVFEMAMPNDVWLHTQKLHSAHTLIVTEGKKVDENTLLVAAQITAYYSQAKDSGKTAVDYTLRKHLKKPPKARKGLVIYNVYETIIVEPNSHSQLAT